MSLSLNERVHTLLCPGCGKYIASDAAGCRFCGIDISPELLQQGVTQETEEIRKVNFAFHRNFALAGLGFFALGAVLLGYSLFSVYLTEEGAFFIYSPVLLFLGVGQLIYGFIGMYKERRKKN